MNEPLIVELAQCVRNWAESKRHRHNFSADLCGMCAIANAHLYRVLKDHGIRFWLVENDHHVFLLRQNRVLDVTATQFGDYGRVLFTPLDAPAAHKGDKIGDVSWWQVRRKFATLEQLNAYMKQTGWPPYQTPTNMWDPEFIKNPRAYE